MKSTTGGIRFGLRVFSELIIVAVFLIPVAVPHRCSAQSDSRLTEVDSEDAGVPQQSSSTAEAPEQAEPDEGFPPEMQKGNDNDTDQDESTETALDTDLPISALLSPLRLANISLLSLTTDEGYNSNPSYLKIPLGSYVTSINGLVADAQQFAGWQMIAQYQPFIWLSSQRTLKSFAAASLSLRTVHRINGNWHWTLSDHLRYSPTHATDQSEGFVADPGGGFSIGNAFLSSGRNVFVNGAAATLTDLYGEHSSIVFRANQSVTRLSSYIGGGSGDSLPTQDAIMFLSGVTWRNHYSFNNTLSLEYNFRIQATTAAMVPGVQSHLASVGWSHKFNPRFGISASGGPAWSIYGGQQNPHATNHGRTTLHGSFALSRQFRRGDAVLSFSRSDGFTGVISDSFHNRYEASVHREITSRLNWSASASYIQQQIFNARSTDGELYSTEGRYFINRNLAFFGQVRYLKITGNQRILAPETNAVMGIRWAWVPEKP